MMPKSILVPLDESPFAERAIPVARALATQLGADLAYFAALGDGTASQAERYLEFAVAEHGPADVLFSDDTRAGDSDRSRGRSGRSARVHDQSRSRITAVGGPRQRRRGSHP